ncbi:Right handed beta helix region [Paenibacillus sp. UNCCL117]|uniref:right-handed parallel beta-helix repeat-containing protein n=1 Tax=unclassified Paenibacillus TaxID=185978 RepID=UPI00088608FD|nr:MULTISPECIES: right-handed parallel beta-helix repeat-containing protein [unclassified Paenibacillus]SDC51917.1 Right handed beta helix region [Paenibacillus sp. cl123]SFW11392.1 Right handed beta helix region [Paenibacillus sp. UNCCL117]
MNIKQVYHVTASDQLLAALEACRTAGGETEIVLAEGDYCLASALVLDAAYQDLVLRGEGRVRLLGGRQLKGWQPIQSAEVLARLNPAVRGQVMVCDLAEQGIRQTGSFVSRGFGRAAAPSHAEVFWNGKPLHLSQYPKRGEFLTITGFAQGQMNELEEMAGIPEHGFYYDDEQPASWAANDDLWIHGYWSFDWAQSYEHVRSIDLETRHVRTNPPYAVHPFRIGQRFCFLNILEEVRSPGDYYIDRKENKLYFCPDSQTASENSELLISMLETPMLKLEGCRGISLIGLTFECTRGNGLQAEGASDLIIDRCLFRHIGNTAVHLEGGERNSIRNCTIHHCGDGGINAFGGDRATLASCEFALTNNHIYRIGQWSRCYNTAINIKGVGIRATHNLIHDLPHIGILYWGNDIVLEHNEIYSVCMETGDAGAIYSGRDLSSRGNRVCHNFIHHLGGVGLGTMGIYNDDGISGTVMEDNFFLEVGRAAFMGGGVDFVVKNNVFVKCYPAITADSRVAHTKFFWDRAYAVLKKSFYEGASSWRKDSAEPALDASQSPYIDRYPELAEIDRMFRENRPMTGAARISRNVFCSKTLFRYFYDKRDENNKKLYDDCTLIEPTPAQLCAIVDSRQDVQMEWSAGKGSWLFEKNFTAQPSDFADAKWGDIAVRQGSEAYEYGYERRELSTIGLIEGDRDRNPPRILTSLTYPYKGERTLTLAIRNASNQTVSGVIQLHTSSNVKLKLDEVPFTLAPEEEHAIVVGNIPAEDEFAVEARSELPGVRPSRA